MRQAFSLPRLTALGLVAAALATCTPGPSEDTGSKVGDPGVVSIPRVDTPAIKGGKAPKPQLAALPRGARAQISNQDMGRIFVTLRPQQARNVSSGQVL